MKEMDIGKKLAAVRNRVPMSQDALAAATGIQRPHIQKLEGDAHSPSINTLSALLVACGSSLAEFFESKIPDKYADPHHQELHEKLQAILEAGGERETGIKVNIEAIFEAIQAERTQAARRTKKPMDPPKKVASP
jgi:transcriptional regulator with XRE-family HTH domain